MNVRLLIVLLCMGSIVTNTGVFWYQYSHFWFTYEAHKLYIDFTASLNPSAYPDKINNFWAQKLITTCHQLYQRNNLLHVSFSASPKIPKIIHQIWLGSSFPEKYRQWQRSWRQYHPDWHYILWTDKDIEAFGLSNKKAYDAASNFGQRSDIARYEILYRIGGLYVDTDVECLRSFDILHHAYTFYIGLQPLDVSIAQLGIGVIGSAPGSSLLKVCIDTIDASVRQHKNVMLATGPIYFTRLFMQTILPNTELSLVVLPPTYFYPCLYTQRGTNKTVWQRKESFAVHHWEGSWCT